MPRLPQVGTRAYNGFQFPSTFQATVSGIPIMDRSGRTVKYYQWTFIIEGTLVSEDLTFEGSPTPGVKIDVEMDSLRVILTTPAREFVFHDQGFGDLVVNKGFASTSLAPALSTSVALDADYGPKPKIRAWQPRGSNHAVFISWECTVTIPQNCLNPEFKNSLAEYNYNMSWSIDDRNTTIRTTNVIMEIPMTRRGATNRLTQTTIDKFRSSIDVPTINGPFKRASTFNMSDDKRTMTATITDTEIHSSNPYFPGMVKMEVNHTVSSSTDILIPISNTNWKNRISGRVEVALSTNKALGWTAIQHVINTRMGIAKRAIRKTRIARTEIGLQDFINPLGSLFAAAVSPGQAPVGDLIITGGLKLITALSITEELYGRGISFSVEYIVSTNLVDLLGVTGLFTPIPGDWTKWRASLDIVDYHRGFENMQQSLPDVIVDLCIKDRQEVPGFISPGPTLKDLPFASSPGPISKDDTWLTFYNRVTVTSEPNTIPLNPLSSSVADTTASIKQLETGAKGGRVPVEPTPSKSEVTIQKRAASTIELTMTGFATRVALQGPPPQITSIGGKVAVPSGTNKVKYDRKDTPTGIPIYTTTWQISYALDAVPRDLKPGDIKIGGGDPGKTIFTNL